MENPLCGRSPWDAEGTVLSLQPISRSLLPVYQVYFQPGIQIHIKRKPELEMCYVGSGDTMLQQVHRKRLPHVGRDLCLTKQKGFVSHMAVSRFCFVFFLGLSFPVCKNKEMPAYQKGMVKEDIPFEYQLSRVL